jgi:hypothetical protein
MGEVWFFLNNNIEIIINDKSSLSNLKFKFLKFFVHDHIYIVYNDYGQQFYQYQQIDKPSSNPSSNPNALNRINTIIYGVRNAVPGLRHTILSPTQCWFAHGFVNYKKGALD